MVGLGIIVAQWCYMRPPVTLFTGLKSLADRLQGYHPVFPYIYAVLIFAYRMPFPKRIADNIIDAAIETKYISQYPFEVLIGLIFNALDESYQYTSRPLKAGISTLSLQPITPIAMSMGGQGLFYNELISVRLLPNAIGFACLAKYIGWEDYRREIESVLTTIGQTGYIEQWTRVGVRYMNEYVNTDLKECTKFNFTFGFPMVQSQSTLFRTEFVFNDRRVIMNLSNKVPTLHPQTATSAPEIVSSSIIDIDVIAEPLTIDNINALMDVIDSTHAVEKELFFTLLKTEFLQTLKPEY